MQLIKQLLPLSFYN